MTNQRSITAMLGLKDISMITNVLRRGHWVEVGG